jgi:hypothetical protein
MQGQGVAGAALLPVGCDHGDRSYGAAGVGEEADAGGKDPVIVADEDVHWDGI